VKYLARFALDLAWRWRVCLYPKCSIHPVGTDPMVKRKLSKAVQAQAYSVRLCSHFYKACSMASFLLCGIRVHTRVLATMITFHLPLDPTGRESACYLCFTTSAAFSSFRKRKTNLHFITKHRVKCSRKNLEVDDM
jgi:hypothetical protein